MIYNDIEQIVSTTHDTVNKLLEHKNWPDALALYFRYIQQKKMQNNNQTLSSTRFMKKAMWRWQDRFTKAKKILLDNWFVEDIQERDSDGKIVWWYVKVNFVINLGGVPEMGTGVPENQWLENPLTGKQVQNTLIEKLNTPIEKTNTPAKDNSIEKTLSIEEFVSVWNSVKSIWREKWLKQCKMQTKDIVNAWNSIIKEYTKMEIEYWLKQYVNEIESRDKWTSYKDHRFSLYEFITQKNWLKRFINT